MHTNPDASTQFGAILPRLCIVSETFFPEPGGTPTQCRCLLEGWRSRGGEARVLTRRTQAAWPRKDSYAGYPVTRVGPTGQGALKKWALLLTLIPSLLRNLREADVIFVPGFRVIGLTVLLVAVPFRKKVVFRAVSCGELDGSFFSSGLDRQPGWIRRAFGCFLSVRKALFRKADLFVAISSDIENEYLRGGIPEERIVRIPNGVDLEEFHPLDAFQREKLAEQLGLKSASVRLVYTGRLVRYKGLIPLLEAWRRIAADWPEAQLILVGEGGNDTHNCEQELHDFVQQNGLEGSVVFTGRQPRVADWLQVSDIFLFPTENEAFGISLIEAMACGLPAVSTEVGGVKDIVGDSGFARVVSPGDVEGFVREIQVLLEDESLRGRMGARARELAVGRYGNEAVTAQYVRAFGQEAR
ncbi:MAG: glycosyltransferase family 4 protein [Kiritimatiellia bacterium]